ncbi:hypothetical protein M2229_000001, partial [Bradyrhizobium japonicum]|nr:hypothetical protein [Bradyrhizobium japonicum]
QRDAVVGKGERATLRFGKTGQLDDRRLEETELSRGQVSAFARDDRAIAVDEQRVPSS